MLCGWLSPEESTKACHRLVTGLRARALYERKIAFQRPPKQLQHGVQGDLDVMSLRIEAVGGAQRLDLDAYRGGTAGFDTTRGGSGVSPRPVDSVHPQHPRAEEEQGGGLVDEG